MRQAPAPDAAVDLPAVATPITVDAAIKSDPVLKPDALPSDVARPDAKPDTTKADANAGSDSRSRSGGDDGLDAATDGAFEAGASSDAADGALAILPAAGDLVIDELLINPAGTDTNREWIEVANVSSVTLDLRQLHVADAASDVAVDAGVLAPGGLLILGQSLDPTKNGGAPIALSFGNVVSLNNGGDSISVCLGPCASGVVLDQVVWTADLGAAYDGHAAIVGATPGQFCPADQPYGDAGSFGSPGMVNPPCIP